MRRELTILLIVTLLIGMAVVASRVVGASPRAQQTDATPTPQATATPQATVTPADTGDEDEEESTITDTEIITGTVLPEELGDPETENGARTLTVVGTGEVTAVPDTAFINLGVETIDPSVQAALDENNQRVSAILDVVNELGIPEENVQTSEFNISAERPHPEEEPIPGQEPGTGSQPETLRYRVSQQVRVEVGSLDEDLNLLGELIDRAVDAGANNVFGPSFRLREDQTLQQQAQRAAVNDAYQRAQNLATLTGVELAGIARINESPGDGRMPIPVTAEDAGGGPPLEPGTLSFSQRVEIVFFIR